MGGNSVGLSTTFQASNGTEERASQLNELGVWRTIKERTPLDCVALPSVPQWWMQMSAGDA